MFKFLREKLSPPTAPRIMPRDDGVSAYLWPEEELLLTEYMKNSTRYVEFGSGGSTIIACDTVRDEVISVDSSLQWHADITKRLAARSARITPHLHLANIGPVVAWGWPMDSTHQEDWANYYTTVWPFVATDDVDLYFIDGRFRVACFMEILARCTLGSTILVHDFHRPEYHIMAEVAQEIARVRTLVAFRKRTDIPQNHLEDIQARYRYDPR